MEELKNQLHTLEQWNDCLDDICSLVCILRDALQSKEGKLDLSYSYASFFISKNLVEIQTNLRELTEDLFQTLRSLHPAASRSSF